MIIEQVDSSLRSVTESRKKPVKYSAGEVVATRKHPPGNHMESHAFSGLFRHVFRNNPI